MFNVVADQLKVSQGWVRCGQCADVFDATLCLQNESAQLEPEDSKFFESEPVPSVIASADADDVSYAEDVTAALKTPDQQATPVVTDAPALLRAEAIEIQEPEVADALDDMSSDVPGDVSFMRDARRQAFWRRPLVRAGLSLSILLLGCLLVLQYAVAQRDSLAAFEPRLKPALQMVCEQLACSVGPLRQIETIVIDSSSFSKVNDTGIYRLSFALKNTGLAAVAMPSLEVTLTDMQDQPVLRRVLSPTQLGAANGMLSARAEFSGALGLQVTATTTASDGPPSSLLGRVAGYRLLAFYP